MSHIKAIIIRVTFKFKVQELHYLLNESMELVFHKIQKSKSISVHLVNLQQILEKIAKSRTNIKDQNTKISSVFERLFVLLRNTLEYLLSLRMVTIY